jgi:hypothetical protein
MRQRIWRPLFAAAVGLLLPAGASAQPQTAPPPMALPPAGVIAQPAPGPVVPSVPAAVSATPVEPGPGAVISTHGQGPGGGSVAPQPPYTPPGVTNGRGYYMSGPVTETRLGSGINGCGSLKQDLSFVFGPCKSFFAPCGGLHYGGCGGGHGGGLSCWRGGCATPVYGTGRYPHGFNTCCYDSYVNH